MIKLLIVLLLTSVTARSENSLFLNETPMRDIPENQELKKIMDTLKVVDRELDSSRNLVTYEVIKTETLTPKTDEELNVLYEKLYKRENGSRARRPGSQPPSLSSVSYTHLTLPTTPYV